MNIVQLGQQFPDENSCREFFEAVRWTTRRICLHHAYNVSNLISNNAERPDRYACKKGKRQFTVTAKTPLHSTQLSLWKWLEAMYLIISSSKGIYSVVLESWIGVTQPTAWKMEHAIRIMMDNNNPMRVF